MNRQLLLFVSVLAISFFGSLPVGTLNISVANYTFRRDFAGATGFSLAAISVEVILVRVALAAIRRLERLTRLFRLFSLLTIAALLALAFSSLLAAWQMQAFRASLPFRGLNPVLAGLLLSAINPLHLPFWMGWTAVLKSRKILDDRPRSYTACMTGIAAGTALAFTVYGLAGTFLIPRLSARQPLLNWIVGIALLAAALAQAWKTFLKPRWFPE